MKIGELARETDTTTKTIRYYESIGLIAEPDRSPNGYRSYDTKAIDRLRFVSDAQAAGLTLSEIDVILELRDEGQSTCHHVVGMLEEHLESVDRQLVEMTRTRDRLTAMLERARDLDPANCTDPNSCQTIKPTV